MEPYEVRFKASVRKDLRGIPRVDLERLLERARGLARDPRPVGSERLSARERYRIRQGDYRVLYTIDDAVRVVEVVKVGHRRDVYRLP